MPLTTPISDEALYVFGEASKKYFGNVSSLHEFGTEANRVLNMCRKTWAHMINSEADGIYFTSGGTKRINLLFYRSFMEIKAAGSISLRRKRNTLLCIIYANNWKMKGLQ